MNQNDQLPQNTEQYSACPPGDILQTMMDMNVHNAKSILELARVQKCMDSQEFINWQDELNAISITYK